MFSPVAAMRSLSVFLLIILLLGVPGYLKAQQGSFLVNNQIGNENIGNGFHFEIISDRNGLITLAHNQGILQYDGNNWDYFPTPNATLSIAIDNNNVVFIGGFSGFGKLGWDQGNYEYVNLFTSEDYDLFYQTMAFDGLIYFLSESSIYVFDPVADEIIKQHKGDFSNMFMLEENLLVNTLDSTFVLVKDQLTSPVFSVPTNIVSATRTEKSNYVLTEEQEILSYSKKTFSPVLLTQRIQSLNVNIQNIAIINDSLMACGTLNSGVIFINPQDSGYLSFVDHKRGLPDDEIYALHIDEEMGVWVSHEYGLSRILPLFPAKSYGYLQGLQGNLLSVDRIRDTLWVSTSNGLYYLDQDTSYISKVYYEVKPRSSAKKKTTKSVSKKAEKQENASKKKVRIKPLFNKKNRKANQPIATEKPSNRPGFFQRILSKAKNTVDKISGKPDKDVQYIRRVTKIPRDVQYSFKKIQGTSGKSKEFIQFKDQLLLASTNGIFEVEADQAIQIFDEPIQTLATYRENQLLVSTYSSELKLLEAEEDIWSELHILEIEDEIQDLYVDKNQNVWISGASGLWQLTIRNDSIVLLDRYDLENDRFDPVFMTEIKGIPHFIYTGGIFQYNQEENQFIEATTWNKHLKDKIFRYFKDSDQSIWIYDNNGWHQLDTEGQWQSFTYLNIFPALRAIHREKNQDKYWLLTQDNDLLVYDARKGTESNTQSKVFLKTVTASQGMMQISDRLRVSHDNTYLSFAVSKPHFSGVLQTQYRYRLLGMNDQWSDWTEKGTMDFSYLPPGKYTLEVASKDNFGNVDQQEIITFKVNTPYWQQPWFYMMQVLLFGSLVYLSSTLNQSNKQNQFLSSGLSILTLIMIIEFLQSAIASYLDIKSTPVVDFLIDVGTALMVFPFERFLREVLEGRKRVSFFKRKAALKGTE